MILPLKDSGAYVSACQVTSVWVGGVCAPAPAGAAMKMANAMMAVRRLFMDWSQFLCGFSQIDFLIIYYTFCLSDVAERAWPHDAFGGQAFLADLLDVFAFNYGLEPLLLRGQIFLLPFLLTLLVLFLRLLPLLFLSCKLPGRFGAHRAIGVESPDVICRLGCVYFRQDLIRAKDVLHHIFDVSAADGVVHPSFVKSERLFLCLPSPFGLTRVALGRLCRVALGSPFFQGSTGGNPCRRAAFPSRQSRLTGGLLLRLQGTFG